MFVCTRGCIVSLLGEGGGGLKSTGMTLVIAEKHCACVCVCVLCTTMFHADVPLLLETHFHIVCVHLVGDELQPVGGYWDWSVSL